MKNAYHQDNKLDVHGAAGMKDLHPMRDHLFASNVDHEPDGQYLPYKPKGHECGNRNGYCHVDMRHS